MIMNPFKCHVKVACLFLTLITLRTLPYDIDHPKFILSVSIFMFNRAGSRSFIHKEAFD